MQTTQKVLSFYFYYHVVNILALAVIVHQFVIAVPICSKSAPKLL